MSTLKVDEILKRTGTGTITLGQSGDTLSLTGTTNITGNTAITGTLSSTGTSLGKIGQVVNAIDSTNDTFTSATLTAASCTASITPSATSSKILVMYNAPVTMSGDANSYAEMRLFRGTTELRIFTDLGCYNGAAQVATQTFHYDYLDSPSSTSSLTYSVKYAEHGSASLYLNHTGGSGGAGSSTMTLLEVLS